MKSYNVENLLAENNLHLIAFVGDLVFAESNIDIGQLIGFVHYEGEESELFPLGEVIIEANYMMSKYNDMPLTKQTCQLIASELSDLRRNSMEDVRDRQAAKENFSNKIQNLQKQTEEKVKELNCPSKQISGCNGIMTYHSIGEAECDKCGSVIKGLVDYDSDNSNSG